MTDPEKRLSMTSYGDPGSASQYEFDHLVPLSVGGSPNSPRNLWPQPGASPNPKDKLEGALRDLVCARKLITRASGKKKVVLARYVRNNRLADALHQQAFSALSGSPGARAYYDALRDRDISYNAALRQLPTCQGELRPAVHSKPAL